MNKILIPIILMSLTLYLFPILAFADTADECDQVDTLIDNIEVKINRAIRLVDRPRAF